MQIKEKVLGKKRGTPGFTDKRFKVPTELDEKVDQHKRKMELKSGADLKWEDAAIDLLAKATRNIKVNKEPS
jgi:hypothetical protein